MHATHVSDHFLYVACIGPFALAGWMAQRASARWSRSAVKVGGLACVGVLAWLMVQSIRYIPVFDDARSFWSHALTIAPDNAVANLGLGVALRNARQPREALPLFLKASELQPELEAATLAAATIELDHGDAPAAERTLRAALAAHPTAPVAHMLATVLFRRGDMGGGLDILDRAVALDPASAEIRLVVAQTYLAVGRSRDAYFQCIEAIRLQPDLGFAYIGAATCLKADDQWVQGAEALKEGLRHAPGDAPLQNMLALFYAAAPDPAVRRGAEAVDMMERLRDRMANAGPVHLQPILDTLAAAYAETGRFEHAVQAAEQAALMAEKLGDQPARQESLRRAAMYQRHEPLRLRPGGAAAPESRPADR
jgi:tetratricopeptide (TPR) repeat protein